MGQTKNTFIKGMNKDTSLLKYSQAQYENARNFRPITDEGLSTGAMENIQGTALQYEFPIIKGFVEIDFNGVAYDSPTVVKNGNIRLEFTGATSYLPYTSSVIISASITFLTPKEYLDKLVALFTTFNASLPNVAKFIIYRDPNYDRLIVQSPIYEVISIPQDVYSFIKVRKPMKDFMVIGSTHLRDKSIIFTVSQPNKNYPLAEGQDVVSQIWQGTYDPYRPTIAKNLKLLYYGDLRFSLNHPIEAQANYENEEVQMIYWTDNYNPPRKLNIANKNALVLREDDLLLSNKAQLWPALVQQEEQIGGALPTGLFYVTYKLQKFGGSTTAIAPWSNATPISADPVAAQGSLTNYELTNYALTSIGTEKSLNYTIPALPKGYDKIFVYAVYEKSPKEYFTYLIAEEFLSDALSFDFKLSSVGDKRKLNLSQLLDFDVDFETVKSMAIKDRELIFANVKLATFDLDWDARAYRFQKGTNNTYTAINTSVAKDWLVDRESDVINPHNDDRTDDYLNPYKYQRGSQILGGSGPKVSYEFIHKNVTLDQSASANPSNLAVNIGTNTSGINPIETPLMNVPTNGSLPDNLHPRQDVDIPVDLGPGFPNFKNNRYETYFKGHMRDEVYRFAVVFYSTTGRPAEAKWIADIRFPCDGDLPVEAQLCNFHRSVNSPTIVGQVIIPPVTGTTDTNAAIGASIGIKFTVDVSDIADKISGYSIVRSIRKEKDRTILAQGAFGEVVRGSVHEGDTLVSKMYNQTSLYDTDIPGPTYVGVPADNYGTFDSPDLKFISGARVFDYVGARVSDDSYFIKPVAGFVHVPNRDLNAFPFITEVNGAITVPPVDVPLINGNNHHRYSKSLMHIASVDRSVRLAFTKKDNSNITYYNEKGKLESIIKVGAAQVDIEIGVDRFDNRGFNTPTAVAVETNGAVTNKNVLVSPGCQTVLMKGVGDEVFAKNILNAAFGKASTTLINNAPHTVNNIGDFGYFANAERTGHVAIVDLYRHPKNQYGGNTYIARQSTQYISTGNYTPIFTKDKKVTTEVFGGDCYVTAFAEKKLFTQSVRDVTTKLRILGEYVSPSISRIYPVCSVINTDMRVGFHINNYRSTGGGGDIELREEAQDDYLIPIMYHREKDLQPYFIEGAGNKIIGAYDNRLYISDPKTNGENSDSWSVVKPLNKYDVDGTGGPINKILVFNDQVLIWQDKAFAKISVNPRVVIQSIEDDIPLELGTGRGITDAQYVSNSIGAFHQWGILAAKSAVYWFDAVHKKFMRYTGNKLETLSDEKGLASWFHNDIEGSVLVSDNPIIRNGVTCTYDSKYQEVIFTFHSYLGKPKTIYSLGSPANFLAEQLQNQLDIANFVKGGKLTKGPGQQQKGTFGCFDILDPSDRQTTFDACGRAIYLSAYDHCLETPVAADANNCASMGGTWSTLDQACFLVPADATVSLKDCLAKHGSALTSPAFTEVFIPNRPAYFPTTEIWKETIVFGEAIDAFSGFYDHFPTHYINDGRRFFSQDPDITGTQPIYIHEEGERTVFYGDYFKPTLNLVINPEGDHTKIFNNMEFFTVCSNSSNDADRYNETFTKVQYFSEYQNTGDITLIPDDNIKRRMRTWRTTIPRDGDNSTARMRNPYMRTNLEYDRLDGIDKRFVVHDITTHYLDVPM